jgi:hypothetical protein
MDPTSHLRPWLQFGSGTVLAAPGSSLYGQLRSYRYGIDDSISWIFSGTNQIDVEIKISLQALGVATDGGGVDSLPLLRLQVGASPLVQCLAHASLLCDLVLVILSAAEAHRMTIPWQSYRFESIKKSLLASDVDVQQASLCVVINQPVGNPKRKV